MLKKLVYLCAATLFASQTVEAVSIQATSQVEAQRRGRGFGGFRSNGKRWNKWGRDGARNFAGMGRGKGNRWGKKNFGGRGFGLYRGRFEIMDEQTEDDIIERNE